MHEVFISYARSDEAAATLIASRLADAGLSVFFDTAGIVTGESWSERMNAELVRAGAVVVLLSSNSRRSTSVQDEVQTAIETKKLVIPVLLDEGATQNWLWPLLATRQSLQLDLHSKAVDEQLSTLVKALRGSSLKASTTTSDIPALSAPVGLGSSGVWKSVVLAAASAAIGALVTWLLR